MDDRLLQELQETRLQLNSHLLDLRRELSRVRQSMQQQGRARAVDIMDGRGGYLASPVLGDQLERQRSSGGGPLDPSSNSSSQGSGAPRAPRAASWSSLPPIPRFPLNPTSTPSLPRPPNESSSLYEGHQQLADQGLTPAGPSREFDPSRTTRGSVRLLSRVGDSSGVDPQARPPAAASATQIELDSGWEILLQSPTEDVPAQPLRLLTGGSSNRTATGVPESDAESSTTRQTSTSRAQGGVGFVRPGSAAASLLFGSVWDGPGTQIGRSLDARRNLDTLRATFLPRTVNIPPPSIVGGARRDRPALGLGGSRSSPRGEDRPRPDPPRGNAPVESADLHPDDFDPWPLRQRPTSVGELDPNGESLRFDPISSSTDRREPSTDSEMLPLEPSVWSTLPALPPTPIPSRIETFAPSPAPDFGAPGFDRESDEAHRRTNRTSGLLEDLQQRRERLRTSIAALRDETPQVAPPAPGVHLTAEERRQRLDRSANLLETLRLQREAFDHGVRPSEWRDDGSVRIPGSDDESSSARGNLRPPEQSTPVGSPSQPHRTVSARLLEALGGDAGLGELGQRTTREQERERAAAGGDWDGWGSYTNHGTGTVEFEGAWIPRERASSPASSWTQRSPEGSETLAAPRRTRSVLQAYLEQAEAPPAAPEVDAVLRRAEQEEATSLSRRASPQGVVRRDRAGGSRRNAPWLLGDGDQDRRTDTRSGDEARFWPDVHGGNGTVIIDVPRSHVEALFSTEPDRAPLLGSPTAAAGGAAGPPHPWRHPSTATAGHRAQGIFIRTRTPPHQHRGPSFLDYNGDPLVPGDQPRPIMPCPSRRSSGPRGAPVGAPPPPSGLAPLKRDSNGNEEWFERPGPVELPAFLRVAPGLNRRWAGSDAAVATRSSSKPSAVQQPAPAPSGLARPVGR